MGCYPQNKHVRKIYNNFTFLDDEVKLEVLRQRELNCELIKWIYEKIDMVQKAIQELDIGDDFLYDGGKYLTRAYNYKNESIESLENIKNEHDKYNDYYDYFHIRKMFQKHSGKLTYEQYLEDYLYCKFDKPDLIPKKLKFHFLMII